MEYGAFGFGIMVGLIFAIAIKQFPAGANFLIRVVTALLAVLFGIGFGAWMNAYGWIGALAHVGSVVVLVGIMAMVVSYNYKGTGKS